MNRLTLIAQELNALGHTKWALGNKIANLRKDYEARKIYVRPADGWPGKNAEDRKFAEQVFCAGDEVLRKIDDMLAEEQAEYDGTLAMIDGLTDERRSLEWTIRAKLVDALAGNNSASLSIEAHDTNHDTTKEFDDAAQGMADDAGFGLAGSVVTEFFGHEEPVQAVYTGSDEQDAAAFFGHEAREEQQPPEKDKPASEEEFPF